jgi:hypothetical protein
MAKPLLKENGIASPIRYNLKWRLAKDYSFQVWFILAQWFQKRRLKCEMLKDGRLMLHGGTRSPFFN